MEIERRHWIVLPREVTLEEAMDLLRDRRRGQLVQKLKKMNESKSIQTSIMAISKAYFFTLKRKVG
jgi:hypothetical protein